MRYTIEDLIEEYADYNEMSVEEGRELYEDGRIGEYDLLDSYLHNEGIFGYTSSIWSIFEALSDKT